ncbi:lipoyl synthase [Candidatus Micrarchaeota archaeon]|nr:lipoyl synthase [Candidatus Micrarchaeota archaeon]
METKAASNLPEWLKIRHSTNANTHQVSAQLSGLKLHSVCQSAHCPNRSECWAAKTASFMVMGEYCTRACRFCAVKTMAKPTPLDPDEPVRLANAVASLGLRYVVVTSVTRDDLPDGGAGHIARCVGELRRIPGVIIETLVPDFRADKEAIRTLAEAGPDVVSHNIETVERLTPIVRDRRAGYRQSLEALRKYHEISGGEVITKSGLMVGLGETDDEVRGAMADLREAGVDILTLGQYLSPSKTARHLTVKEYIRPEKFSEYGRIGYALGFLHVASGPLVRSSYRAAEPFIKGILKANARR